MKKLYILLFISLSFCRIVSADSYSASLSGNITDKKSGESLVGVTVYLPDLKTGTVTDINGHYELNKLPETKVLVQVSFLGYRTIIETIDLSNVSVKNFKMEYVATELNEVVVTGLSRATEQKRAPEPIMVIPSTDLMANSSTNIIDAIARHPGVSQITTGASISKPVIRGLGYNRVVVVNDGIRQEGQQWGDEHGIEVDEFSVNRVEVLKGPASLVYGSDAMAGVINLLSAPILPEGKMEGKLLANYQTNNGLYGLSADVAGNKKGRIWDLRLSNKAAHSYKNKYDGYVFNSGFKEEAVKLLTGINRSWGYLHLDLSAYHLKPGIIEGERDSLTGKFVKATAFNDTTEVSKIASHNDFMSYNPFVPYQQINHYKAVLSSEYFSNKGDLRAILGVQQNQRKEFGEILDAGNYGLYFLLNTISYDISYNLKGKNDMDISCGVNGMWQNSLNKGTEYLIPEYHLFDFGIFTILKKRVKRFDISGGLRFDSRNQHAASLYLDSDEKKTFAQAPGAIEKFAAFHSIFSGLSGSIGLTYQIDHGMYSKFNISRGFRAPSIAELGSNGVHEGTLRYETGDPDLKPENSLQFDFTYGLSTEHVSAELNLFDNIIDNYIYSRKLINENGGDSISEGLQTFKFVSGNAHLSGSEIRVDIHPHPYDWIHFENTFAIVNAVQSGQPDSLKYLPLIPPAVYTSDLKFEWTSAPKMLKNAYIAFGIQYFFKQDHYYKAYQTETATPAYTLMHIDLGTEIHRSGKKLCSVFINLDNIADVAYQSHLSRLKYAGTNYVTNRTGVYNMGRNISFKLLVPLYLK